MARQTKSDLERIIKLQMEVIDLQEKRMAGLQQQMMQNIESSPTYQNAIRDARIAQEIADMYKEMYENLQSQAAKTA